MLPWRKGKLGVDLLQLRDDSGEFANNVMENVDPEEVTALWRYNPIEFVTYHSRDRDAIISRLCLRLTP